MGWLPADGGGHAARVLGCGGRGLDGTVRDDLANDSPHVLVASTALLALTPRAGISDLGRAAACTLMFAVILRGDRRSPEAASASLIRIPVGSICYWLRMGLREYRRNPVLWVLLVVVPIVFIVFAKLATAGRAHRKPQRGPLPHLRCEGDLVNIAWREGGYPVFDTHRDGVSGVLV